MNRVTAWLPLGALVVAVLATLAPLEAQLPAGVKIGGEDIGGIW